MLKVFRWQGFLGFIAIVGLFVLFWMFYASTLIKNTIESYGSDIAGAKVDVGQVNLSFDPLGIALKDVQIADAEQPMKNLMQWQRMNMQVALSPLLSGQVIIQDISMKGLAFNTDRNQSGALLVVQKVETQPSQQQASSSSTSSVAPDLTIKNKLPSVSEILERETLLTEQRGETLKGSLQNSKIKLKSTLSTLPNQQTLQAYNNEFNRIIQGKIVSLDDFKARKEQLAALKQRLQDDKLAFQQASDWVKATQTDLNMQLKALKSAPTEDFERLKNKYQMNFDGMTNISKLLFGEQIAAWLPILQGYYKKAQPIIEQIQSSQEEEKERERLEGRFVRFPLAKPQPDFLIERMNFSIHLTHGNLLTEWRDITHQQGVMNRPTTLHITGEGFSQTANLDIKGLFDHRGDQSINQLTWDMNGLNVKDFKLAGNKMLLKKAKTHITGRADLGIDAMDMTANIKFENADFINLGTSQFDQEMALVLKKVDAFDVDTSIQGNPLKPNIHIASNLDKMLSHAMKKRFHQKKAELTQKLKERLTERMLSYTGEYQEQFKQLDIANNSMAENRKNIELMLKSELNDYIAEQKALAQAKLEAAKQKALAQAKAEVAKKKELARTKAEVAKKAAKEKADAAKKKEEEKLKEKLNDKLKSFGF
ncbi:MAG: TIGR03545 family protein [Ghiorsea sp.]|nr:TIGR03545 family protein [Ghiorsea sp.]